MSEALFATTYKFGGAVLVATSVGYTVYANAAGSTLLTRYYQQYRSYLDRRLSLLFLSGSGRIIIVSQGTLILLLFGLSLWTKTVVGYPLAVLTGFAPAAYLYRARISHVRRLEAQVDSLITGLANALRTVPSPAAAMKQVVSVLPAPMRLEVQRLLNEMRLGTTLEQSLLNTSRRVRSPDLDSALSALLIGLQVGGNLPEVLETTAATIREMNRLEGVIKTKTAEGRAQLWVLAVLPVALFFAFRLVDQNYFAPMAASIMGNIVAAAAVLLWLGALPIAYRILKVDI